MKTRHAAGWEIGCSQHGIDGPLYVSAEYGRCLMSPSEARRLAAALVLAAADVEAERLIRKRRKAAK